MKVTVEWMKDFDCVCQHMLMNSADIEECKQEARDNPGWALVFYPRAARTIREIPVSVTGSIQDFRL